MSMNDERQGRPLMVPSWLLERLEELDKAIGGQLSLFDESKVSRHGKGPKGGQFAPKGGAKGGGGGGQPKMPNPATQHGRAQVARMLGQKPPVDDKGRYQSGPLASKPTAEKQTLIAGASKRAKQFMAGLDEDKARQSDDFSQSRALLTSMGYSDEQQDYVLSHFESHGGYDDAEVLWNVHPDIVHDALVGAGEPAGGGGGEESRDERESRLMEAGVLLPDHASEVNSILQGEYLSKFSKQARPGGNRIWDRGAGGNTAHFREWADEHRPRVRDAIMDWREAKAGGGPEYRNTAFDEWADKMSWKIDG